MALFLLLLVLWSNRVSASASPAYGSAVRTDDGALSDGLRKHLSPHRRQLVVIHAIFGALAWLLFAPIAIITARYFKSKLKGGVEGRKWFRIHFLFNCCTVIAMILTFVLGYFAVGRDSPHQFNNPHLQIGTAVFVATSIQALLGLTNHFILRRLRLAKQRHHGGSNSTQPSSYLKTPFANKCHFVLGWITWGLGVSNIPVGLILYGVHYFWFILYGLLVGSFILLLLALEGLYGRDRGISPSNSARPSQRQRRVSFQRGTRARSRQSNRPPTPIARPSPSDQLVPEITKKGKSPMVSEVVVTPEPVERAETPVVLPEVGESSGRSAPLAGEDKGLAPTAEPTGDTVEPEKPLTPGGIV